MGGKNPLNNAKRLLEARNINRISWFAKQLQHKSGVETLKLSLAGDEYMLTMENDFTLEHYFSDHLTAVNVSIDSGALYYANIEQGQHYRLNVNGQVVLFKIRTRQIWFFDSVEVLMADMMRKDQVQ